MFKRSRAAGGLCLRAFARVLNLLLVLVLAIPAFSATIRSPRVRPEARKKPRRGRHLHWNPLLRGSHDSLLRQNAEIDRLQLPRISDDDELEELVGREELVAIRDTQTLRVDPKLDRNRRFCRPWTLQFLEDLAEAYYKEFRKPIQVNSAVRTIEQQKKLRRYNRNAAPAEGDTASSHLAGITVDIAKRGMSRKERKWIGKYFLELKQLGLIEAAEERRQACFHVMVSSRYTDWRDTRQVATD